MKKDYSTKITVSRPILTEEIKRRKRRRWLKRAVITASFFLFIALNYVFWGTPLFKVKTVVMEGEYDPQIRELLQPLFEKHYLTRHILFIRSQQSREEIERLVPHLISASVSRDFPSSVVLTINQRIPSFVIAQPDGSWYLADRDTFVYLRNEGNGDAGERAPLTIEIPTTTTVTLNTRLYEEERFVNNLWVYINQLDELFGIKVTKIRQIGPLTTHYSLYSQKKWFLMVDLENDAADTLQTLKTFFSEKYQMEPSLKYLDARIPRSIFYQ